MHGPQRVFRPGHVLLCLVFLCAQALDLLRDRGEPVLELALALVQPCHVSVQLFLVAP